MINMAKECYFSICSIEENANSNCFTKHLKVSQKIATKQSCLRPDSSCLVFLQNY